MESDILYKAEKDDLPRLEALLNKCFAYDPLYQELIPDEKIRNRLLPQLFVCDITESYENCEIFADSDKLQGMLVVSDESTPYNFLKYYFAEIQAVLKTDGYLIKEDPSLKTFFNFAMGRAYLNSNWTTQLHQNKRLHIIYLAVDPQAQHHGIAAKLIMEVIRYADENKLMISLETHNPKNIAFYERFGFKIFGVMKKYLKLKQYCLIREIKYQEEFLCRRSHWEKQDLQ
ncbi:MAG: N-acetyltransferase [Lachnospiraceae bacterium]|nr:N-acetyltransferase [Lachnospiraceae bacterium]